jgi:ribosomal protein S18 acetylase RimI-like enzyme
MITIVRIDRGNALIFREARLRALQESPDAFSASYAREALLTESDWFTRIDRLNGKLGIGFLAMDENTACGIVAGLLDQEDTGQADLISMWVAPDCRRRGIGRKLVDAVLAWATARAVRVVCLMVTCDNEAAIRLYQSVGFALTGTVKAHAHDPRLRDCQMSKSLI